jgi:hypothetical protein
MSVMLVVALTQGCLWQKPGANQKISWIESIAAMSWEEPVITIRASLRTSRRFLRSLMCHFINISVE